jgi:hypothetical protein
LICLPEAEAEAFCKEIEAIDGRPAWIIGRVLKSESGDRSLNNSTIVSNPTVIVV